MQKFHKLSQLLIKKTMKLMIFSKVDSVFYYFTYLKNKKNFILEVFAISNSL